MDFERLSECFSMIDQKACTLRSGFGFMSGVAFNVSQGVMSAT